MTQLQKKQHFFERNCEAKINVGFTDCLVTVTFLGFFVIVAQPFATLWVPNFII